ncbi:radical SAM family heme chaperone HemW [Leptolyngbya sp. FACHB-16]|uniref:radical SAM family heme chaperone HemW n=1 Tax=Leptolyngbya sp. NM3-A1 TaxID=2933910 RepID=UPI001685C8BE|nr:coproporphyrinogen III oxidase [Leptolyngbya sp. FACHB-16]
MSSKRVEITIASTPGSAVPEANFAPVNAAYIHIPFCRRRCFYCDFPISVVGDTRRGENSGAIAEYVTHLCQEIQQTSVAGPPLETIFFGGGTPSLLAIAQLETILNTLQQKFGIAPGAEISMEMDPGTFDRTHVEGYEAAGVNRVSLGVQAFQAELLQVCGRTHQPEDIPVALDLVRQAGIKNVGIDLISGLPQQTLEQWEESLRRAIALSPTHLSVYDLIVEPGTAFARQYRPGEGPLPPEETAAQMYRLAQHLLTAAGYEHYEISNYAQPGYACRHNRVYWENRPYYGFGMGAASYVGGQRFTRPRTRQSYYDWLQEGMVVDAAVATTGNRLLDALMLGLRLADGINLTTLKQEFGDEVVALILKTLTPYEGAGWVERPQLEQVRLSDPEGFLLSNTILAALFERFSID